MKVMKTTTNYYQDISNLKYENEETGNRKFGDFTRHWLPNIATGN